MELRISNIGKIKKAEIEVKGVTVITGYNSTGKSTVCKALYGIMDSYSNMRNKVFRERISSMVSAVYGWQNQINVTSDSDENALENFADDLVEFIYALEDVKDECISMELLRDLSNKNKMDVTLEDLQQLLEKLTGIVKRDKNEYVRFIVSQNMKGIFANQMGHVNESENSRIFLNEKNRFCSMIFENGELVENDYSSKLFKRPIYMEPESILDHCERTSAKRADIRKKEPIRTFLMRDEIAGNQLTLEQYQEREKNSKLIREILDGVTNGHLVKNQNANLTYAENGLKTDIACKNIASGLKPFLMIQRMVENGSLEEGRLLIIDEPEVNLHPAWQLKFAKVLVLLNTELKIQVVISTHSPYFLKAVDYYLEEQGNTSNGRYYLTEEMGKDLYTLADVTDNKERIYKTMYEPLEELD